MVFNSIQFVVFLFFIASITASLHRKDWQISFLLISSLVFYYISGGIFIISLIFVICITFFFGRRIFEARKEKEKKIYLALALSGTLAQLAVFKHPESLNLSILLPIGISFYTFQSLSYVIDIYRGRIPPASSLRDYALFVSFFPQMTSGPIVRAGDFLSQLKKRVQLDIKAEDLRLGMTLIGIGLLKKLVLADNIAPYADVVFSHPMYYNSLRIILATVAFGIQLYFDFSGYSDIAIGSAAILGFRYPANFNNPYLSMSPSDFWSRWHISLSTFLRDYLYIPLGGNRRGDLRTHFNLMITMTLCGLWHGGSWNFIIWGVYHGCLLSLERLICRVIPKGWLSGISNGLTPKGQVSKGEVTDGKVSEGQVSKWRVLMKQVAIALKVLITQFLVFLGWLIFRVENSNDLAYCLDKFIFWDFLSRIHYSGLVYDFLRDTGMILLAAVVYIILVSFYRDGFCEIDWVRSISSLALRYWLFYLILIILIITWLSPGAENNFIYSAF